VPTELELDHFFWKAISTNVAFQAWFLGLTKFADHALDLVGDEIWHQKWYRDPVTGKDSETDILLIFKHQSTGERFAIISRINRHGDYGSHTSPTIIGNVRRTACAVGGM
jgi:hypothetical protein